MKMFSYRKCISSEQLAVVLFENCVISFQEVQDGDVFDPIRDRIKTAKGRIRRFGSDYLAYALIDTIVDSYFIILDDIGDKITSIDESLTTDPQDQTLRDLHELKREMIYLRRSVWPLRELINNMQRSENSLIKESTGIYLRDVYDHTIRVIETVDTYRDMIAGMMDIYHSIMSNRMNEIMKVLTIISTIFIPVTFIAGVYGMNFDYMPELRSKYGYIGVWILMISIMGSLVVYFRKKKWF
jgi:magnesium transporter